MGVVGPIFELHSSNLVSNHIFYSCKSAEILVRISQVVLNLAKSVWSVLSISSDVLGLRNFNKIIALFLNFHQYFPRFSGFNVASIDEIVTNCQELTEINLGGIREFVPNKPAAEV